MQKELRQEVMDAARHFARAGTARSELRDSHRAQEIARQPAMHTLYL